MTMKTKKTLQHIAVVAVVLLALCLVFMMPAAADSTYTGEIVLPDGVSFTDTNTVYDGTNYYATLAAAVTGIHNTENANLYCKPGADVGETQEITSTETLETSNAVASITRNGVITKYATLQAAIDDAADDDTIILLTSVEQADGVLITNKKLTINLNGKIFNVTAGSNTNNRNFKINGASEVTIMNGVMFAKNPNGLGGDSGDGAYGTIRTEDTAKVTLTDLKLYNYRGNGLNIKALSGTTVTISNTEIYSQYGGGIEAAGGTVELTNVKVEQKGMWTAPYNSMAISVNYGGKAIVHSGTYTTECLTAEEANEQGSSHGPWAAGVLNSGGTLTINGGTFSNDNFGDNSLATYARGLILADTGANIDINGGTFNALKSIIDVTNNLGDASNNPSVTLSGGAFSADPRISGLYASELITVEEGYVCVGPTDGKYTVEEANPEITATPSSVSATLTVGYEQPTPQTITVENTGNVELTLAITKTGFDNITVSNLPDSQILATSESFSFTVQLDAGLAAGTYSGTITLSNESIENKVIPVSFTVSDSTSEGGAPGTTSPGSTSSSGKGSSPGDFQYYPRAVPADGVIDFGTSPVVTGMEVPVGSSGIVTLNTKPTFTMPENGFYAFEIDAPGYNLAAKINGGLSFQISLADLEAAGWTANDIVLFHGTVGEDGKITWEALPTNLVANENGVASYKAAINGCSPFYIGFVKDGSIVNTPVVEPTDEPETPTVPETPGEVLPEIPDVEEPTEEPASPAPILAVLAGLGAAVVLRRK